MELLVDSVYTNQDLRIHMPLHAITTSDITTPAGCTITHQAFNLTRNNGACEELGWPRDIPIPDLYLDLW